MNRSKKLAVVVGLALLGGCAHHHHHHDYDDEDNVVVRIDDCPPPVRDHFYRDHPGVEIHEIRTERIGGEIHYHFTYAAHGEERETHYSHEGEEIRVDQHLP